jgi:hypothetical protein
MIARTHRVHRRWMRGGLPKGNRKVARDGSGWDRRRRSSVWAFLFALGSLCILLVAWLRLIEMPGRSHGPSLGADLPGLKGPGEWSDHNVYVVVDVANAMRIPHLGAYNSKGEFDLDMYRRRLGKIGNLLIQAADRNGDVYWRNLSTFLEYVGAVESAAKAAQGAGIAAAFISPVLGAALAGSGVATDAFFDDVTDSFDVETYAQLRESASTKREIMAKRIHTAVASATPQKGGLESVIRGANDYAYSYSLKGTIYITKEEDDKLKDLLITGESSWSVYFLEDRIRYLNTKLLSASEAESQEIQRQLESARSVTESLVKSSKEEAERLRKIDRIPVGSGVGSAGG